MAKFLGIDTSCYTTSAAVYDSTEGIVGESRMIFLMTEFENRYT